MFTFIKIYFEKKEEKKRKHLFLSLRSIDAAME